MSIDFAVRLGYWVALREVWKRLSEDPEHCSLRLGMWLKERLEEVSEDLARQLAENLNAS